MILITGGGVGGTRRSVDVLRSDGSPLPCNIPNMPNARYWHTQSGLRVCGGHGGVSMVGDEMENEIYLFFRASHTFTFLAKGIRKRSPL